MTLPVTPGSSLSLSQVNTEILVSSTATISLNDANVRFVAGRQTAGSSVGFSDLSGKSYVIAANSGVLTSGSSYTLPNTSGVTIKVLAIAGGAGGGGGSSRSSFAGFFDGAGGGGAGGNAYTTVSVTPGQTVYFSIGGAGSQGASRDGVYSSGSNGGSGGSTSITVNGTTVAVASGGSGGLVSPNLTGGSAGGVSTGSALVSAAGGGNGNSSQDGGNGGNGYSINTSVGATTILTLGSAAAGADGPYGGPASTGVAYGGGGGGGGTAQSDVGGQQNGAWISGAGTGGAVFIWWGY